MRIQAAIVVVCVAMLAASLLKPVYPREQWLQHVPSLVVLTGMALAVWRRWLSTWSLSCVALMLALHVLGARWIYSFVPYDDWSELLIGRRLSEVFTWQRNHYDRLVHFAFGLLTVAPASEAARRFGGLSVRWSVAVALLGIVSAGAGYEVLEWMLAVIAAPDFAERYNGQQGDFWDAQKDMALAGVGAAFGVCLGGRRLREVEPAGGRRDDNA